MGSVIRRALVFRALAPVGLGVVLALGGGVAAALADDVNLDGDQVTISVTITPLEPCALSESECPGGGDDGLAMTGLVIGAPLAAGVLLAAIGATAYTTSRRRSAASS